MRIAMTGTACVGFVSGVCVSGFGREFVCVDKVAPKIGMPNNGGERLHEPGCGAAPEKTVAAGRLSFTTDIRKAVAGAEAVVIAFGAPTRRGKGDAGLTAVCAASGEIARPLSGYTVRGEAETAAATAAGNLPPIGVAVGARRARVIAKDAALTCADVTLPQDRIIDRLRAEQAAGFGLARARARGAGCASESVD